MSTLPLDPKHRRKTVYRPDPLGRLGQGDFVEQRDPLGRLPDISIEGLSRPDRQPRTRPPSRGLPPILGGPERDFPGHVFFPQHPTPPILGRSVGRSGANDSADVTAVEWLLGQSNYLDLAKTDGPTGYFGLRLEDAIRRFQKDHGLKTDGTLLPEGPTLASLHRAMPASAMPVSAVKGLPKPPASEAGHADAASSDDATFQEAAAPALGIAIHGGRMLWQYLARGAAAGAVAAEAARRQQNNTGSPATPPSSPMTPAPSLPPLPPSEPPRDRTPPREEFPGVPLPPTNLPGFTPQDIPNLKEVYPQEPVTAQDLTLENRRGGPATQEANRTVGGAVKTVAKSDDLPIEIVAGGGQAEKLMRPPGDTKTAKGGSYTDTWARCETTGRSLHVNTVDVRADGVTPSTREEEAAVRIIRNKESGDILILLPKLPDGQQYDPAAIAEFLRPYLNEICEPAAADAPNTREPIRPPQWPLR